MNRKYLWVCYLFLLTLLPACSKNSDLFKQRLKTAPQSQTEAGYLIKLSDAENSRQILEEFLSQNPKAQVRPLYNHVYEVFNLSKAQLLKDLELEFIYKNDVFSIRPQNNFIPQTLKSRWKSLIQHNSSTYIHFKNCRNLDEAPLKNKNPLHALNHKTLTIGSIINQKDVDLNPHDDQMGWLITPPYGSALKEEIRLGKSIQITPDTLGLYSLSIIVKNPAQKCIMYTVPFIVTSNTAYEKNKKIKNLPQSIPPLDQSTHLSQLEVDKAWGISRGQGVIIAVIDTGVNYNHPLLRENIHINPNEIPDNNIDDDNNGLIDDTLGYDFVNNDALPFDDDGHGTHVAGLAAGRSFGIAPEAQILPIKALSPLTGDSGSLYSALVYAIEAGANVINLSMGSEKPLHPLVHSAILYAKEMNVTIVTSAGNGDPMGLGVNIDQTPLYPSSYKEEIIISVAAHSQDEEITTYSNFGKNTVDLITYGGSKKFPLLSTYIETPTGTAYRELQGTSMASPIVAGLLALMVDVAPQKSALMFKNILLNTGPKIPGLKDYIRSGRHINAYEALKSTQIQP